MKRPFIQRKSYTFFASRTLPTLRVMDEYANIKIVRKVRRCAQLLDRRADVQLVWKGPKFEKDTEYRTLTSAAILCMTMIRIMLHRVLW